MKRRITLKDIANNFNVSIATVSKALKDSHEISSKTKDKIQHVCAKKWLHLLSCDKSGAPDVLVT